MVQAYILNGFDFSWGLSIIDSVISCVLLAMACWLINNNLRYYQPGKGSYVNLLIWCVALALGCATAVRWLMPLFSHDVAYINFLLRSLTIRAFTDFLAIGWMAMISLIWYAQVDQKENEKRKTEAEKLARDAEL